VAPAKNNSKISTGRKINIPKNKRQGDKKADDFHLRVGLVIQGKKQLSWMQKKLAPSWVLQLYKLAPKNAGVDKIHYLSAVQDYHILGGKRTHWASDLITEEFVSLIKKNGEIVIDKKFDKPYKVLALWISVDGDDTASQFQTLIKDIRVFEQWP